MLSIRLALLLVAAEPLAISAGPGELIRFEGVNPGTVPSDWVVAMTHAGGAPRWEIVRDESAPSPPFVLAQLSRDVTAGRFPLAIWNRISIEDGEVSVAFKPVDGSIDQAAGLVWRYQDANNYYIARANALENNVVLYKVQDGVRTSIAPKGLPSRSYGVRHTIPRNRWSILRTTFCGSTFAVFLNQERMFETEDASLSKPGKVGLWTKADSLTYFDDFRVSGPTRTQINHGKK